MNITFPSVCKLKEVSNQLDTSKRIPDNTDNMDIMVNTNNTVNTSPEFQNTKAYNLEKKENLESFPSYAKKLRTYKLQLKHLYKKIDSISNLLWSHENHLIGKRLRSEVDIDDIETKWMNKNTTQIGYGEISMGSLSNLFNLFQNLSKLLEEDKSILKLGLSNDKLKSYNLTSSSYFLDIGSGFGKPVFHGAYQVGCYCMGIEVVPARVEFCMDFFYEFISKGQFFDEINKIIDTYDNCSINSIYSSTTNNNSLKSLSLSNLNSLHGEYYEEILIDNEKYKYLDLKINKDYIYEDDFVKEIMKKKGEKKIGILVDSSYELIFGEYFSIQNLNFQFNNENQSNVNINKHTISDKLENQILKRINYYLKDTNDNKDKLKDQREKFENDDNFNSLIGNIGNIEVLDFIIFINAIFNVYNFSKEFRKYNFEKNKRCNISSRHVMSKKEMTWRKNFKSKKKNKSEKIKINKIDNTTNNTTNNNDIDIDNSNYNNLISDFKILKPYTNTSSYNELLAKSNFLKARKKIETNHISLINKQSLILKLEQDFMRINNLDELPDDIKYHRYMTNMTSMTIDESIKCENPIIKVVNPNKTNTKPQLINMYERCINQDEELLKSLLKTKIFQYNKDWYKNCHFIADDATKYNAYEVIESDGNSKHYTHIYSYNKVMSNECRNRISKVLNKTDFKVLAWYLNPIKTYKSGLKNYKFVCKFPMQSTSTEKFVCYIYIKTDN